MSDVEAPDPSVWYAAFGSNLSRARMDCYLAGGRPAGTTRDYEGCRDPSPPRRRRTITLRGSLAFGGESGVWGGGMAFFRPGARATVHARAYLIGLGQLGDVVAQEARLPVGVDLELAGAGRPTHHGLSRVYDVLVDLGELDGHRVLTLTSTRDHRANPPSAAYARTVLEGLADGFGLDADARVAYLAAAAGVTPAWTRARLRSLTAD